MFLKPPKIQTIMKKGGFYGNNQKTAG